VNPDQELRTLYALAYLERLRERPARAVPLDDTSRAPIVPLRPNGGDRA
jgi:hypothetical protein